MESGAFKGGDLITSYLAPPEPSAVCSLCSWQTFVGEDGDEDEEMEEVTTLRRLFLEESVGKQIYLQYSLFQSTSKELLLSN